MEIKLGKISVDDNANIYCNGVDEVEVKEKIRKMFEGDRLTKKFVFHTDNSIPIGEPIICI